jgi:hypothetical protein
LILTEFKNLKQEEFKIFKHFFINSRAFKALNFSSEILKDFQHKVYANRNKTAWMQEI